jgi:uncharacterized membrane protein (TIGR01666 family)
MLKLIRDFTDGTNFNNAIKATLSAVIPVLIFSNLGSLETGLTIALGALFTLPSDIPSNLKHKIKGITVSILFFSLANLLINLTYPYPIIFVPVFCTMVFILSMLAVYGQRATMVAFSTLLIISISFAHIHTGWEMIQHSLLLFAGGLFYLLVSTLFQYLYPHRYTELEIEKCIHLTSKYLKLRGDLWEIDSDRKAITKKQLLLQVELNEVHENIREVLIRNRTDYGSSHQNRKMLLSFVSLVEIMELAISTSFDHNKLHQKFDNHPEVLKTYQNLAYNLAKNLKSLSKKIRNRKTNPIKNNLNNHFEKFEKAIKEYSILLGKESTEGVLMLTNMLHYAEKQIGKINYLEKIFTNPIKLKDLNGREKDIEKLITKDYYPLSTLIENLSFSSLVFRHSLRITLTLLIGFIIGKFLPFENVYWILLTIVVIMRPGYGLTKERTLNRFIGTVVGGFLGFLVLSFGPTPLVLGVLTIVFLILGLSFSPSNYRIGTLFITLHVLFIFAILNTTHNEIIIYRILDTLVGALLALFANHFFWPFWEFLNTNENIENSIKAIRNYLMQISIFYNNKQDINSNYRLARNQAFIEIGNLMASFQRMLQEPKSKQNNLQQVYKITVINNAMLSSVASLGTYTQTHKTTDASTSFNTVIAIIISNLDQAIAILNDKNDLKEIENLDRVYSEIKKIRVDETNENQNFNDENLKINLQEIQLIKEQLIWLANLSANIVATSKALIKS